MADVAVPKQFGDSTFKAFLDSMKARLPFFACSGKARMLGQGAHALEPILLAPSPLTHHAFLPLIYEGTEGGPFLRCLCDMSLSAYAKTEATGALQMLDA